MRSRSLHIFWLLVVLVYSARSQFCTISGTIRDSVSGERLGAATIRILGSPTGTISNPEGNYKLTLPQGSYQFAFSYIGYKTDTVQIDLKRDEQRNIALVPAPVQLAEVVVTGEDPAIAIMRNVIANKKRWIDKLDSYRLEAFTRQVLRRDTAIAVITESYSTCYWQKGDTLREIVRQKRQTENIKGTQNFAGVGGILNFYDDDIRLAGFTFVGPTSPSAFDYYDFKLVRTRHRVGSDIFDIKMIPRSRVVPLFEGSISIADGSFAVAGVSVTPNEAFVVPFISELKLSYGQQFSLIDNEFWMPVDIRMDGLFRVGIAGLSLPAIGIESVSSIYDCSVNVVIPDSIFRKPRRVVLKESDRLDSTFWAEHDVLPLTEEERAAYRKLDSTQTLEKQFQPSGPLVVAGNLLSAAPLSPELRFNRVEGLFLGGSMAVDSLTNRLRGTFAAGYAFSDKRPKGRIGLELFVDSRRTYSIGIEAYRGLGRFPDGGAHDNAENLFSALLYKTDYFDYFYTKGFAFTFRAEPVRKIAVEIGYQNEDQSSAFRQTNFSVFAKNRTFETNPTVWEGTLSNVWLRGRIGDEPVPLHLLPRKYVQIDIGHSSPDLGSSFDFTQLAVRAEYHTATYLQSLFLPPTLMVVLSAATSWGIVPPQRYFRLDSPLLGYAPIGVLRGVRMNEFAGDSYYVLTLEHNFRNVPFLWLDIPFLYKNSIEFLTFAQIAQAWSYANTAPTNVHSTDGLYGEIGCGVSRIFGLLRLDVTYRLTVPRRTVVTMGIAMVL